jgi:hypothetical protein
MLDFLKFTNYDHTLIEKLECNPLLSWKSESENLKYFDSEVITTKKIKEYKGILFCFYANRLDILFKPHYYFNGNLHNANDFTIIDCINTINVLKNDLNIDLNLLKVVNIEFGVNVISPIDIKDLITYLVYHEKNEFKTDSEFSFSKKSYSVYKNGIVNKYKFIKAYAKGIQFPEYCNINTFRFEIKSKKSRYINSKLSIYTATDLLREEVYLTMAELILKEFKEVLILDCDINLNKFNLKEQKKVIYYNNFFNWYKILNQSRNSFSRNKKKYHDLIDKEKNNLKNQLEKIIIEKLEYLKKGAISHTKENNKKGAISHVIYRGNCTQYNLIKCSVTGLDISMQKDSLNLSHTGLRYYYNNDLPTFNKIKNQYLSKVWYNSDINTQIKEIAHNIRNAKSNQNLKLNRIYQPQQINLLSYFNL